MEKERIIIEGKNYTATVEYCRNTYGTHNLNAYVLWDDDKKETVRGNKAVIAFLPHDAALMASVFLKNRAILFSCPKARTLRAGKRVNGVPVRTPKRK